MCSPSTTTSKSPKARRAPDRPPTGALEPAPGRSWWLALWPIALSVLPVVSLLLLTGLVPLKGIVLIPVTGIFIGGALTATVLSRRRALDELSLRHGEFEAGPALGLSDRDARMEIARPAASDALLPGLDQTRTVGPVTLPGAFVGMLLGGAGPTAAGAVQLFVLVALMAIQAVAVACTVELVARGHLQHRTYTYRPDGYVTQIRELTAGTRNFTVDPMGRVTGVQAHGWTEKYGEPKISRPCIPAPWRRVERTPGPRSGHRTERHSHSGQPGPPPAASCAP